jgi:hypothetical protein
MTINDDLYLLSPEYRRLADEYIALQRATGAIQSAYLNALGDQQRAAARTSDLAHAIADVLKQFEPIMRDDPGRGGSGGARQ